VEANTRSWSCHSGPAASRSAACRTLCSRSASAHRCGSASVLLDFGVFVSPPAKRDRYDYLLPHYETTVMPDDPGTSAGRVCAAQVI
jgi:hypothetical protein